jgi:hypothetical protein
MLVVTYSTTSHHILEDNNSQSQQCKLSSHMHTNTHFNQIKVQYLNYMLIVQKVEYLIKVSYFYMKIF